MTNIFWKKEEFSRPLLEITIGIIRKRNCFDVQSSDFYSKFKITAISSTNITITLKTSHLITFCQE